MLQRGVQSDLPEAQFVVPSPLGNAGEFMSGVAVLVVAAGQGERAGGAVPKQYAPLLGKPILRWTLDAFARHPKVDAIQVVIGAKDEAHYTAATAGAAAPGGRRSDPAGVGDARPGSAGGASPTTC